MQTSANSGPGYRDHPGHRIDVRPADARVRVTFKGEIIADSSDTIRMNEGSYPAVYYFPRKDVRMDRLLRSSHRSYCPFKGEASYFSLVDGPADAVWSYEAPYDEMRIIQELLAFYPDKVDSITIS
jgi:uncharacterized protein (DUF427 family)